MPQSSYSNKDLKRFDRTPGNYTDYGPVTDQFQGPIDDPYANDPSAEQLLTAAKGSLGHADQLEQETGASSLASMPERLAELSSHGSVVNPRADLRNLTEKLHSAGVATGLAAIPGSFVGAGPLLGAAGVALSAPDVARRMILPDEDESRLGGFGEAALLASPLALKGLKTAYGARQAASTAANNSRMANEAERELVDSFAAQELASGSQKTTPTILRRAHEKAGRVHGSQTLNSQQLHPEYPEAPALNIKRPSQNGLMEALAQPVEDLSRYEMGPRIERGLGDASRYTPEQQALYHRYVSGAAGENLNAAINRTAVRPRR